MFRYVLAVLLAPSFWLLVGFPGNQLILLIYPEVRDDSVGPLGYMLLTLAASGLYAMFAGFSSAFVAGSSARKVGIGATLAVFAWGIAVVIRYNEVLPLWYQVSYLALIIPATILGTRIRRADEAQSGEAAA